MSDNSPAEPAGRPLPRAARVATAVAFAAQGFFLAAVLTQLPQFKDRFGFGDSTIVIAVVLVSLLAGVGSVAAEFVAARTSSKATLTAGLLVVAASGILIGVAPTTVVFFTGMTIYGVGLGMVDATTNMQAVSIQHRYGRSILSSFHAVWSVGSIVGALWVSLCSTIHIGLTASIVTAAVAVGVVAAATGPRLLTQTADEAAAQQRQSAAPLTIPWRPFVALGVAMALFYAIDFSVGNWSAMYLKELLLSSAGTAALALAAYQGAGLVSRLTGDLWVRRYGEIEVVRVGAAIGTVGLLIVVFAQNPATAIAGFLVVGLGVPVVAPLCFSAAGRLAPPSQTDGVIARLNLFNYAGTIIGGGIVGGVAAVSNLRVGFAIPLVFAAALIVLARAFHPTAHSPARTTVATDR